MSKIIKVDWKEDVTDAKWRKSEEVNGKERVDRGLPERVETRREV